VNVLNILKHVCEVCSIFFATADPVVRVAVETELGRGILGVVDDAPAGVETVDDEADRKTLLRRIGYNREGSAPDRFQQQSRNTAEDGRIRQCACQAAAGTFSLAGLLRSVARGSVRRTSRCAGPDDRSAARYSPSRPVSVSAGGDARLCR
jgi:hypothetical protein